MPVITVQVPTGSLDASQKSELIARLTDVLVDVEKAEPIRPFVYVVIDETARDGYGLGGVPIDVVLAKTAAR